MAMFGLFVEMQGLPCLVAGGGEVALRKALALLQAGAQVTLVAPAFAPAAAAALAGYQAAGQARLVCRTACEADLAGARLAFLATNDRARNASLAAAARAQGIPCNIADDRPGSDFLLPAQLRQGPVTVAVSTGGASPTAARVVRGRLRAALTPALGQAVAYMGRVRGQLQQTLDAAGCTGYAARRAVFAAVFAAAEAAGGALDEAALCRCVQRALQSAQPPATPGQAGACSAINKGSNNKSNDQANKDGNE